MIEASHLLDYGAIGTFCAYLIYDRQVLIKKLMNSLDRLADAISMCPVKEPISL